MMSERTLILGNKAYSSWSLRPWLALKQAGLPFAETVIPLRQPDTRAQILAHSPTGKVPCLIDGDRVIWDSLAICEYIAELAPAAALWPEDFTPAPSPARRRRRCIPASSPCATPCRWI